MGGPREEEGEVGNMGEERERDGREKRGEADSGEMGLFSPVCNCL